MRASWIRKLFRQPSRQPAKAARRPSRARLGIEALEDRAVPAAFLVTDLIDANPGSLRQAILDANAYPGADSISFAPALAGGTISLTSGQLPNITGDLTITGPAAGVTLSGGIISQAQADTLAGLGNILLLSVSRR